MKHLKSFFILILFGFLVIASCTKENKNNITEYIGTVVEGSEMKPLPNVKVSVTNGERVLVSTYTDGDGAFSILVNFLKTTEGDSLLFDGSPDLPYQKKLALKEPGKELYDYRAIVLYNKNENELKTFQFAGTTYYVHPEVGKMNWQSAVDFCEGLTYFGYSDWFLPDKNELNAMYVYRNTIGGFVTSYSNNYNECYYWSSTTTYDYSYNYWYLDFRTGEQKSEKDQYNSYYRVRPVRKDSGGGGGGSSIPAAPTGVTAEEKDSRIKVSWDNVPNAESYTVYWSNDGNTYSYEVGTTTNTYIFDNDPLEDNYYKVKAKNNYGESPFSSHAYCHHSTGGTSATATIVLTAGDVWGDGSGYQMLLDKSHSLYGSTIPTSGALSSSCSGNASIYAQFDYKIPTNADGNCTTQNMVFNNSVSLTIPAGVYDWCITNPTPDDKIWIASSQGNVGGRQDDYEFEAGKTYEFTVTLLGDNDATDVVISGGGKGKKSMGQSNVECKHK